MKATTATVTPSAAPIAAGKRLDCSLAKGVFCEQRTGFDIFF